MFGRLGPTEILILLGIALLFFGGSRIANVGKGLGEGIKNFKKASDADADAEAPKLSEGKTASQKATLKATEKKADA